MQLGRQTTNYIPNIHPHTRPYSLVYGVEEVLPLECEIRSLRITIQEGLTSKEKASLQLSKLKTLHGKRLKVQKGIKCYQALHFKFFNQTV